MATVMSVSKKLLAIILAAAILLGAVATVLVVVFTGGRVKKHLILNEDGSYGGSLSEVLYGKGAPLNGEYDVKKSDYYTINDFYNMSTTEERVVIPEFSPYQQTMADSSGLACLVMILNYMGKDVSDEYSELSLMKKYEEVNNTSVVGKGTSAKGLVNLVNSLNAGCTAENTSLKLSDKDSKTMKQATTKQFLMNNLKEGKFVLVRYESPVGFGWKVVIGYDSQGTVQNTLTKKFLDAFGDDVIIFGEPYDGADHYQDGYATERAIDFLVWWKQKSLTGKLSNKYDYVVIDPNMEITFDVQPVDESEKQKLYPIYLPRNPDGSYGCTRNEGYYGTITSGNGWFNHTDSNYYKINDFYNMGSDGSRVLISNYTVLQQTMHSSCGVCAVNSVLKYYGEEESYYDMELTYLNDYQTINDEAVNGKGSNVAAHQATLEAWGYSSDINSTKVGEYPKFVTYKEYANFMRDNVAKGIPVVVSTNLGSGHYLTVIGFDDMGTDYIYDDVFITSDSCDYWDGYQDGYNILSATKFYTQHTNAAVNRLQSYIVIYDKD